MNHKKMQLLVSSFVDDEITETDRQKVLAHLEICQDCKLLVIHAKNMRDDIHAIGEMDLRNEFALRIMESIDKSDEQEIGWIGIEPLARNMFYAIALVVLLIYVLSGFNKPSPIITDQFYIGSSADSTAADVLLQPNALSKNDLLFAVMKK